MIIMGTRVHRGAKETYRFYDTDTEFCTIDGMRFGDLRTVLLRRTDRAPVLTLCSTYDAEETLIRGSERVVVDAADGTVVTRLRMKSLEETTFDDRYLIRGDSRVVRIWDLERRDEPTAVFSLQPLGRGKFVGGVDRYVFMCDNTIDEKLQLAFLLYPAIRFI